MENTVEKIFKILTRKDKKNFIFSVILLQFKSVIEVLGIGLIIPILHFMTNHQDLNYIFKYLPFLKLSYFDEVITVNSIYFDKMHFFFERFERQV